MTKDTAKTIAKILHTVKKLQEKFEKERDEFRSQGYFEMSETNDAYAIGALCAYSKILGEHLPEDGMKILEELRKIEGE